MKYNTPMKTRADLLTRFDAATAKVRQRLENSSDEEIDFLRVAIATGTTLARVGASRWRGGRGAEDLAVFLRRLADRL